MSTKQTYDAAHVELLKGQLSDVKRELKIARLELASMDTVANEVKKHAKAIGGIRKPRMIDAGNRSGITYEGVLMLSDFHFPEIVSAEETEGFGKYNPQICLDRIYTLIKKVIKITHNERKASRIEKLWVMMLGDICSGMIHEELMRSSSVPPIQAATQMGSVMAQAIAMLSDHYPEIEVVVVPGNHGRIERGWTYKQFAQNNLDMLTGDIMAAYLSRYIKSGRVKVNMSSGMECIVVVNGHPFLVGHGSGIKSWGGTPIYGVLKDTTKQALVRSYQGVVPRDAEAFSSKEEAVDWSRTILGTQQFQYRLMGHWHEFNAVANSKIIMNGSVIGANEFSFNSPLKGAADPVQVFFLVSEEFLPSPIFPVQLASDVKPHQFAYADDLWGCEAGLDLSDA